MKKLNLSSSTLTTCQIVSETGGDVKQFNEPAGCCVNPSGRILYVADTNNHQIERIDLTTMIATPLKLSNQSAETQEIENDGIETIKYPNILKIKPKGGLIHLRIILMNGIDTMFTKDAPQKWHINLPNNSWTIIGNGEKSGSIKPTEEFSMTINVPGFENSQGEENIELSYRLMLCAGDLCYQKLFTIIFTAAYSNDGLDNITEILQPVITKDSVVFL